MAKIDIVDQSNTKVGTRELNAAVFGLETDAGFVHRVYASLASAQRFGNSKTKTRSEVSGGGKKPFKQKGTGRARQGSTRATQLRHGGIPHGPHGSSTFTSRLNKKERQRAVRLVLSDALREGRLVVLDKLELTEPKTRDFVAVTEALSPVSGLYILGEANSAVQLSGRNVRNAKIVLNGQMNLHDLLKYDRLVMTEAAVANIEESLA
ncbi:MAG: 50S ribosomal protein L4 [Mariprofundaceae bacterium]|nr:50S ribosomal protein L4 [Mariprofundaceae bacterium]